MRRAIVAALSLAAVQSASGSAQPSHGLVDPAIAAALPPLYLDGAAWTVQPPPPYPAFPATVPGDLVSDLEAAGLIADPLHELNFLNATPAWDAGVFTYLTNFTLPADFAAALAAGGEVLLVCDGIKMVADLQVNGQPLGTVQDQFLRTTWPLAAALRGAPPAAVHTLAVAFAPFSDPRQAAERRWAAFSGGWDWAPYTLTAAPPGSGTFTFTKGIWKSVYLLAVPPATLTLDYLVPAVMYRGAYPTAPLSDATHGGFAVGVTVHASNPHPTAAISAVVTAGGDWDDGVTATGTLSVPPLGTASLQLWLPAANVSLWWPNRLGPRPMYPVTATLSGFRHAGAPEAAAAAATTTVTASTAVGFRVLTLVTGNDSDPSALAGVNGSGNFSMRLRVNGANVYARGGNMIPPDELEGRYSAASLRRTVASAAAAGFNIVRVWGGGIYFPSAFYAALDDAGILAYHDAMYDIQNNHEPADTPTQDAELRHNVRRLAAHPSLAVWDACNECGGQALYASFVATVIAAEDASRPVWPACPSAGWVSGVDRLWSLPNGAPLVPAPATAGGSTIEVHGPYRHGGGWPAINGLTNDVPFDPNLPPQLGGPAPAGPAAPSVFASEFGVSVFPSFESMAASLQPEHWGLHGGAPPDVCTGTWVKACNGSNALAQRNYPADNIIATYFGTGGVSLDAVGAAPFARQLYLSGLASALVLKADIEGRRASNEMGTIIWQLGEVWATGGWGTLEYGYVGDAGGRPLGAGSAPGQVQGGRWKVLHHWLAETLYADVLVACGVVTGGGGGGGSGVAAPAACYLRNDDPLAGLAGGTTVQLTATQLATGQAVALAPGSGYALPALPPGAASLLWFCAATGAVVATAAEAQGCPPWSSFLPAASGGRCAADGTNCVLSLQAAFKRAPSGKAEALGATVSNALLLVPPLALALPPAAVAVAAAGTAPQAEDAVPLVVTSNATALFVTLTTPAQGYFSRNAFTVTPDAPVAVSFRCYSGVQGSAPGIGIACDAKALLPTIRLQWL